VFRGEKGERDKKREKKKNEKKRGEIKGVPCGGGKKVRRKERKEKKKVKGKNTKNAHLCFILNLLLF
jgi:hypothetical protein